MEDDAQISLSCEKMKDAAPFEEITLKLQPTLGSCVITAKPDWHLSSGQLTKNQRAVLESLTRDFEEDGAFSGTLQKTSGLQEKTFYRAVTALVRERYVVSLKEGRSKRYTATPAGRDAIGDNSQTGDKRVSDPNRGHMTATPHLLEMGGQAPIDSEFDHGEAWEGELELTPPDPA
jgi:DNA-binding PadR family transcriptional regulator